MKINYFTYIELPFSALMSVQNMFSKSNLPIEGITRFSETMRGSQSPLIWIWTELIQWFICLICLITANQSWATIMWSRIFDLKRSHPRKFKGLCSLSADYLRNKTQFSYITFRQTFSWRIRESNLRTFQTFFIIITLN